MNHNEFAMQSLDLIQTIETFHIWVEEFDKELIIALGSVSVDDPGAEVKGFWTESNLAFMIQTGELLEQYIPVLKKKAQAMIDELKRREQQ